MKTPKELSTILWPLAIIIALILAIAAPILYVYYVTPSSNLSSEIMLSPLLVISVIALVVTLVFAATVFEHLGLTDKNQTLGLPEGSIRAVIALSLILIFMISSVFIYRLMAMPPISYSINIPLDMVRLFPNDSIAYIRANETIDNQTLYNVGRIIKGNDASVDIAKQIITTLSTLVVAIAAFYFGSKSVSVASGITAISDPAIRSIKPDQGNRGEIISSKIFGRNFELGGEGKVKLILHDKEIQCTDILSSSTEIDCKFSIPKDSEVDGKWSLVVTNADKGEDRLDDAFTVSDK